MNRPEAVAAEFSAILARSGGPTGVALITSAFAEILRTGSRLVRSRRAPSRPGYRCYRTGEWRRAECTVLAPARRQFVFRPQSRSTLRRYRRCLLVMGRGSKRRSGNDRPDERPKRSFEILSRNLIEPREATEGRRKPYLYGKIVCMKKTLNVDDKLLREAKASCGAATDTETVRLGLEALVRHAAYERLRALRGAEPRTEDVPRRRERRPAKRKVA
jgi:Arc/MetJ family transcription regulator